MPQSSGHDRKIVAVREPQHGKRRNVSGSAAAKVAKARRERLMATYEGYCVKCREKREFEGEEVQLANGRPAAQGLCPVCGTKMNRMLGAKK
jgi:hypothetical protein